MVFQIQKIRCTLLVACFYSAGLPLFSQQVSIVGKVVDVSGVGLDGATVSLIKSADSTFFKAELSGADGRFEFVEIPANDYFVAVTLLGFEKFMGNKFMFQKELAPYEIEKISLRESTGTLNEVTVTAQKPFVERKLDRLIINVENSIVSAGSTTLEVLERAPNVFVNQDNGIVLKGKSGVVIYFDGKPTPLTGEDLIEFLKSIPSANIEKIELITNPSAKYDAAGNAGIIDIKFKKDKKLGFNGSATLSEGQGFYNKFNASTNGNYRSKKWNVFGAYSYSKPDNLTHFFINRKFFQPADGSVESIFEQNSFTKQPFSSHSMRGGVDYFLSKKTVVGLMANANWSNSKRDGVTDSKISNPLGQTLYTTETENSVDTDTHNAFINANVKHDFDGKGTELTFDLDLGKYNTISYQDFASENFDPLGAPQSSFILTTDQKGKIEVKSAKADFSKTLKTNFKLEAGAKTSFVKTDNDIQFFDVLNDEKIFDPSRSNHFVYDENVNAGYLNFSGNIKKTEFQVGLRMEHTVTNGKQLATGETFSRNYVNWFPSLAASRKFSESYTLGMTFSRRLERPTYRQLNPFRIFVDSYTFVVGDPSLRPVFTNSVEVSQTFMGRYVAEISVAKTRDAITDIFEQDDATRISNQIPANLQDLTYAYVSLSAPLATGKKLQSNFSGSATWNKYVSPLQGGTLVNQNTFYQIRLQNTYTFGKSGWSAELNGSYQSRMVWGLFTIRDLGQVNAGIQKISNNKNTTFRLNVTDIFTTNHIAVLVDYQNMDFFTDRTWDSRVATLSLTHRFGKQTVQQARRRASGVEDEKRRAGSGQG
ncbi:MAG: TonB-dependent receptor [Saprospiraceae bacterium]|nr:TonB-dependent receptor [Saprospiraceae bacterium]